MEKKCLFGIACVVMYLLRANAYAGVYGPFAINESNTLPDGNTYAEVYIDNDATTVQEFCADPQYASGGLVTVVTGEEMLEHPSYFTEGTNFGIQRFGLNFLGDPADLDVRVIQSPDDTRIWEVDKLTPNTMSVFGVFVYEGAGAGNSRQNPLEIALCYKKEGLTNINFYNEGDDGYVFSCHIADFDYIGAGECIDEYGEAMTCSGIESAFFALPIPTLVELADLDAVPGNRSVTINWTTSAEIDNAGFNIYRADAEDGAYERINAGLIPAKGTPTDAASYRFIDETVQNRRTYYYKLEDVDMVGFAVEHGPVKATPRIMYGLFR